MLMLTIRVLQACATIRPNIKKGTSDDSPYDLRLTITCLLEVVVPFSLMLHCAVLDRI